MVFSSDFNTVSLVTATKEELCIIIPSLNLLVALQKWEGDRAVLTFSFLLDTSDTHPHFQHIHTYTHTKLGYFRYSD